MDSKKLLDTLLSGGISLAIIYALLYFWGYIYYDNLTLLFGFSIGNFDITLYEFLVAGSLSLIGGISIIIVLAIIFVYISNQLKKRRESLLEKYFVYVSAIIYTFLIFWFSSLYSIHLAKKHFKNVPYKEAIIKLKNGERLYCFYRTTIGDKVICATKNNVIAIDESEILLIQLKNNNSAEPKNNKANKKN